MKLRVKVNKQVSRVELEGPEPTLTQLSTRVREAVLPSAGFSANTEFSLSLNGKEPLVDTGQTLSLCGVVSGDMISVILSCTDSSSTSSSSSSHQMHNISGVQCNTEQSPSGSGAGESGASSSYDSRESADDPETEEIKMEEGEEAVGSFIPHPMLCSEAEEGKVPHSLETLYQTAQCNSASDCLVLAVHVLLQETGFLPQGCDVRAGEMPSDWRATGGLYKLQYSHPHCENCLAQVVAVTMGQTLVVNATLKTSSAVENSRKLVLKPDVYVTKQWADENAGVAYRDLQKLSRVFKDYLAYPLIATAREALDLPALFGLATLPPELLLRIMRLLDVSSLLSLSTVCRHLHSVTQDVSLWKHLLHRDFRVNCQAEHRDTDWKELYKSRFKQRKALSRHRMRCHAFRPPVPIGPIPLPLFPPGIIGGEHDRRLAVPHNILPRPRYDPIGPFSDQEPPVGLPFGLRLPRPGGSRAPDPRRGFI
ncbi:F-box only protein 7 [Bagarius yarrelli]|uniref:F-box only protein 7 n=1 Tax=Bagarius yarrelli TaxID=175774 RepID=A0A556TI59_BAGYA|nr:F-box only protein 7 [Bagarius yarrelli]